MSAVQVDKIVKIYKTLAQNSTFNSAKILQSNNSGLLIESNSTQRNLERSANQKFRINYVLSNNFDVITKILPVDITSVLLSKVSENNQYKAILRSVPCKDKDSNNKQAIEIWDQEHLLQNYDLPALDVHGDVYFDGEFGSFELSADCTKLLYIAEKKLEKSEPFYKQKSLDKKNDLPSTKEIIKGEEYTYKPDWGEQMVGKHRPTVCILDTELNTISTLSGIPDHLSPAQVIWTPSSDSIVGVAWKHEPRYLGLIYCTNRESWIFRLQNGKMEILSNDGCCVRSPRFSPDGKHLIWLERDLSGPHHNTHRLMHLNWETHEKIDILVDVVRKNKIIDNDKLFYGLYNHDLPQRCWSADSKFVFFSTQQRANVRSYALNIKTKILSEFDNDSSSMSILDVRNNTLLFVKTSLLQPTSLHIGRFNTDAPNKIILKPISAINEISLLRDAMHEANDYSYDNEEQIRDFNYIYYGPKSGADKSCPLIINPHGGPHSAFANIFSIEPSLLVALGFGVIQVNYRGSTGMGADNVEYLQGRVGNTDVTDCVTATQEALKKYPWLNPESVGLSGGSHGGFLVSHLSGQYNQMYKAVVSRNPVIDIAVMFAISDIPDCRNALFNDEKMALGHDVCAAAINQPFRQSSISESTGEEMVVKMYKCSPIVHVDKVAAPTLLCIGKNDLRVPPYQGKQWYNRLKANGVKTKMMVYDDCHPLNSGTAEIDGIINAALWFCEHLQVNN